MKIMKTAMQLVLKNKVDQLVKYVAEREKFSKASSKYHIYDLKVEQVKEDIAFIEAQLPIERQQLEDAFDAGELFGEELQGLYRRNPAPDKVNYFKTTYYE